MKKRAVIGTISAGLLLFAAGIGSSVNTKSANLNSVTKETSAQYKSANTTAPKAKLTCDGTTITKNCAVDGVTYSTYIYHPSVPEKSHTVTTTSYQKEVTGYCTLCNDGTYSPSCATGRGACSWHGGVQEWNAPEYSSVPVYGSTTVIDAPAQDAYYEKVTN